MVGSSRVGSFSLAACIIVRFAGVADRSRQTIALDPISYLSTRKPGVMEVDLQRSELRARNHEP